MNGSMVRTGLRALTLTIALAMAATAMAQDAWVSLFDGKTLEGWTQKNGTATYRVEDGAIVGKTQQGSPNSFLCTDKEYGDFELEFDVMVDSGLNSGVQIRSKTKEVATGKKKNDEVGRVYGPQVEIEAGGEKGAQAGYIYGEATALGWLTPDADVKPHKSFKDGEWNHFKVVAKGPNIKVWINGEMISDLTHEGIYETHPSGFIGLQVHGIGANAGPYEVRWKNLKIMPL